MTDDERKAQNESIIQRVLDDVRNGYVFPQDLPDPAFPNGLRREGGLTLRDYFAAQALVFFSDDHTKRAILKAASELSISDSAFVARCAYNIADSMLSERAKCAK